MLPVDSSEILNLPIVKSQLIVKLRHDILVSNCKLIFANKHAKLIKPELWGNQVAGRGTRRGVGSMWHGAGTGTCAKCERDSLIYGQQRIKMRTSYAATHTNTHIQEYL